MSKTSTTAAFNRKAGATTRTATDSVIDAPDGTGAGKDERAVLIDIVEEVKGAGAELLFDAALDRELREACDQFLCGAAGAGAGIRAILEEHGNYEGIELADKLSVMESQIGESRKPSQANTLPKTPQPALVAGRGDASVAAIPSVNVVANLAEVHDIATEKAVREVSGKKDVSNPAEPHDPGEDVDSVSDVQPALWGDEPSKMTSSSSGVQSVVSPVEENVVGSRAVNEDSQPIPTPPVSSPGAVPGTIVDSQMAAELDSHTEAIRTGQQTFIQVGRSLASVRDQELYKARAYTSFEAYVEANFSLTKRRAYQLVEASVAADSLRSSTVKNFSPSQLPANEDQARSLTKIPIERRAEVWEAVLKEIGQGKITAKRIIKTAEAMGVVVTPTARRKKVGTTTMSAMDYAKQAATEVVATDLTVTRHLAVQFGGSETGLEPTAAIVPSSATPTESTGSASHSLGTGVSSSDGMLDNAHKTMSGVVAQTVGEGLVKKEDDSRKIDTSVNREESDQEQVQDPGKSQFNDGGGEEMVTGLTVEAFRTILGYVSPMDFGDLEILMRGTSGSAKEQLGVWLTANEVESQEMLPITEPITPVKVIAAKTVEEITIPLDPKLMRAPYPYFGGKARCDKMIWTALGDVGNYIEPFGGSLAALLGRRDFNPLRPPLETVNEMDGYITNFWRSVAWDPDGVIRHSDWPVNEADLYSRNKYLIEQRASLTQKLDNDPAFYDSRIAGWWCWGLSSYIATGWCGNTLHKKRPHLVSGKGVHRKTVDNAKLLRALSVRMRKVRVCRGGWERVLSPALTTGLCKKGITGVFLDPPYSSKDRSDCYVYDSRTVAHDVRTWCLEHGSDKGFRVVLAGYAGEHEELEEHGWEVAAWRPAGGYSSQSKNKESRGNANKGKERLWLSPHCLPVA